MVVKWGWPICHLSTQGPNFNRRQIGYVALSDGQLHPISRDINSYATLSLSADGKTLATVQQKVVSNFYLLPGEGSTLAKRCSVRTERFSCRARSTSLM
jgi:hypothetical protein